MNNEPAGSPGEFIEEPARSTPVASRVDVLVVGGGPVGTMAALAAAHAGAVTMLLTRSPRPASLAGDTLVADAGLLDDLHELLTASARVAALIAAVPAHDQRVADGRPPGGGSPRLLLNPARLRLLGDDWLRAAGVRRLAGALAVAPLEHDDAVEGVMCDAGGVRFAVRAAVTVDATGALPTFTRADGDRLAARVDLAEPPADGCLAGPVDARQWLAWSRADDPAQAPLRARLRDACGPAGWPRPAWRDDLWLFAAAEGGAEPPSARLDLFRAAVPGFASARLVAVGPASATEAARTATLTSTPDPAAGGGRATLAELPDGAGGRQPLALRDLLHPDLPGLLAPSRQPTASLASAWHLGEVAGVVAALAAADATAPGRLDPARIVARLRAPLAAGQSPR